MNNEIPEFVQTFNSVIQEVEIFASMARAKELQEAACERLKELIAEVAAEKQNAIDAKNEDYANMLLGCGYVANGILAQITMLLQFKNDEAESAWDSLINAQYSCANAIRSHYGFHHLEDACARLDLLEKLLFPPQVFMSSGFVVGVQECSICGGDYDDCEHLVLKPYMGQLCVIIARDIKVDHVSIVDHPADKRCRVQQFSTEGGYRNKMTWRLEPAETET